MPIGIRANFEVVLEVDGFQKNPELTSEIEIKQTIEIAEIIKDPKREIKIVRLFGHPAPQGEEPNSTLATNTNSVNTGDRRPNWVEGASLVIAIIGGLASVVACFM